ncbi:hypothetical protein AGMMS49545_08690 [Betaproteobacteria bacterium]|nr:hypothetical protein AGMMS49545_08690 [Betaproteobacteria bacterium]GHU41332.1 hypothetical protein AGMMS50289_04310 [Betaproteobacteria bacterium]
MRNTAKRRQMGGVRDEPPLTGIVGNPQLKEQGSEIHAIALHGRFKRTIPFAFFTLMEKTR